MDAGVVLELQLVPCVDTLKVPLDILTARRAVDGEDDGTEDEVAMGNRVPHPSL